MCLHGVGEPGSFGHQGSIIIFGQIPAILKQFDNSKASKLSQIYPETHKKSLLPFISLQTNILENFDFAFLKEDIQRFLSSTELFLSDIRGLRYTDLKKVNFFVGHPVDYLNKVGLVSVYANFSSPAGIE